MGSSPSSMNSAASLSFPFARQNSAKNTARQMIYGREYRVYLFFNGMNTHFQGLHQNHGREEATEQGCQPLLTLHVPELDATNDDEKDRYRRHDRRQTIGNDQTPPRKHSRRALLLLFWPVAESPERLPLARVTAAVGHVEIGCVERTAPAECSAGTTESPRSRRCRSMRHSSLTLISSQSETDLLRSDEQWSDR